MRRTVWSVSLKSSSASIIAASASEKFFEVGLDGGRRQVSIEFDLDDGRAAGPYGAGSAVMAGQLGHHRFHSLYEFLSQLETDLKFFVGHQAMAGFVTDGDF
jgi:hypothetical protein